MCTLGLLRLNRFSTKIIGLRHFNHGHFRFIIILFDVLESLHMFFVVLTEHQYLFIDAVFLDHTVKSQRTQFRFIGIINQTQNVFFVHPYKMRNVVLAANESRAQFADRVSSIVQSIHLTFYVIGRIFTRIHKLIIDCYRIIPLPDLTHLANNIALSR